MLSQLNLPAITYGDAQRATITTSSIPLRLARSVGRTMSATMGGRFASANVIHIRGVDGIEQAQGITDGVKNILAVYVRKLPKGDFNHYLVNVQQANEWI
jgi:hypothetical protein